MNAYSDRETIAELRAALNQTAGELASLKQQFGDEASTRRQRAEAQQRTNLEAVVAQSAKELDRFDADISATVDTLRAVAAGSALELSAGFVTSREDAVVEVRRLSAHLADALLARARKMHQHETLRTRLTGFAAPAAPKPTVFEAAYYAPSSEGAPPIEAA